LEGLLPLQDVTVAVPTRDSGPLLARVLDAVARQNTRRSVELLALDAESEDGTPALLSGHGARVVTYPRAGFDFGRMRERLFQEAGGTIVVNLSHDAIPADADWLERLLAPLEDPAVAATCGPSRPDPERGARQFAWERNGLFYFTREIGRFRARYGRGLSFANAAVRRSAWRACGFDPIPLGEDFQLQQKLDAAGWRVAFPQDAVVLHHHHYDLPRLYARCRNEGLALRRLGCGYGELDLLRDWLRPGVWRQWAREGARGDLRGAAEWLFPAVRPAAVYAGSRWGRRPWWPDAAPRGGDA
jgi:rhamnosyltransferase